MDGERIVHLLSWHQVQNETELGEALKQVKEAGLIPEDRVRLCVICDGASWIWEHIESLFASARQVLDYYHCSDYLHRMAKTQYGDCQQAHEWVEATLTRLYLGKISAVLGGLKRMQATSGGTTGDFELLGVFAQTPRSNPLPSASSRGLSVG
jgi:hypothetical protein